MTSSPSSLFLKGRVRKTLPETGNLGLRRLYEQTLLLLHHLLPTAQNPCLFISLEMDFRGTCVAQLVKHLPLAQVMIHGSWNRVPHQAPCSVESLLLPFSVPLPLPLLMLVLSCLLSQINKYNL